MLINDVCRECKLTKKAVEYYEQQGLITPRIKDNGYRDYSGEDIYILKEVGVLRKLGIGIAEIKDILASTDKTAAIAKFKFKVNLEVEKAMARKKCLELLIKNYDIKEALSYIEEDIEKHFSIKEKLLQAFPGGYGMYLCIHFGQFLNERIDTVEKERAYNKIIDYLDTIQETEFPEELVKFLQQSIGQMEEANMQGMSLSIIDSVNNTDTYLEENKEAIEKYLEYRNSEEYKNSPAYRMQQLLLKFQQESGYYEIFIENLKILSDSYRNYSEKLQVANEAFLCKYPH